MQEVYNYSFSFEPVELTTKGVKRYLIKGYFSTIDEDLANEVVTMEGQKDILSQIRNRIITLDAEHETYYDKDGNPLSKPTSNIPLGKVIDAELTKKGVYGIVELNKDSPRFKNIWESIKNGFLHAFSVAFYPLEAIKKKVGNIFKSYVNRLNLINITLTGAPMNPYATFTPVMKSVLLKTLKNVNEEDNMDEEKKKVKDQVQDEELKTKTVEEKEDLEKKTEEEDLEKKTNEKPKDIQEKTNDMQSDEEPEFDPELKENKEKEDEEKKIEVKSLISNLKSEFSGSLINLKKEHEAKFTALKSEFSSELKSLKAQITKLENQPIKKAIKSDYSKVLAKSEEFSVFNLM